MQQSRRGSAQQRRHECWSPRAVRETLPEKFRVQSRGITLSGEPAVHDHATIRHRVRLFIGELRPTAEDLTSACVRRVHQGGQRAQTRCLQRLAALPEQHQLAESARHGHERRVAPDPIGELLREIFGCRGQAHQAGTDEQGHAAGRAVGGFVVETRCLLTQPGGRGFLDGGSIRRALDQLRFRLGNPLTVPVLYDTAQVEAAHKVRSRAAVAIRHAKELEPVQEPARLPMCRLLVDLQAHGMRTAKSHRKLSHVRHAAEVLHQRWHAGIGWHIAGGISGE